MAGAIHYKDKGAWANTPGEGEVQIKNMEIDLGKDIEFECEYIFSLNCNIPQMTTGLNLLLIFYFKKDSLLTSDVSSDFWNRPNPGNV